MSPLGLSYIDDPSTQIEEIAISQQLLPQKEIMPNMDIINPADAADSLVVNTQLNRPPIVSEPHTKAIKKVTEKKKKEDTFRSLKASYRVAEDTFQLNLLAADLLNGDGNPAAIHRQIRLLENRISQEQPFIQKDTAWKSAINSAAGILPPIIDVAAEGTKVGGYSALGAGLMATYLSAGPQAVAAPITVPSAMALAFGAGTQAQATRVMARAEAGAIYWDLINMTDDQGNKLDPNLVAGISQGVGAVNGLAELFGIKLIAKFAQPVTKRLLGKAINDASAKVSKSGLIKNLVKQYIKKYPKFVAQESGIELGQAIVTTAGEEMTKLISNELDKTNMPMATKNEIISDLANELRTAAEGIAVLGLPFPMVNAVVDSKSVVKDKNPEGASVLPSDKVLDDGQELMNAYDELRAKYISETDEQSFVNRAQNLKLSNKLRRIVSIEETEVAPTIFPEKVTGPEQAIILEKEFGISELTEIMTETDLEVQRLTEEGKAEQDISKLNLASEIASKHQGAREVLELKYKNETGATSIKPDKFNTWLDKRLKKEAKQIKKVKKSKVQLINSAIQLFIDSKRSPEFVNNIYKASKSWHEDKESIEPKLTVANKGADNKIYIGEPGDLHFNISEKYSEKIRTKMKLKKGEPTFTELGYVDSKGKFLTRKEALKLLPRIKSSIPEGLDALDYKEQIKIQPKKRPKGKLAKVKKSKVQLINSAIQLYIDSKRSPEFVNNIYKASKSWHEGEKAKQKAKTKVEKTRKQHPLRSAFKKKDGTVIIGKPGELHSDVYTKFESELDLETSLQTGFADSKGNFLSRRKALEKIQTETLDTELLFAEEYFETFPETQMPKGILSKKHLEIIEASRNLTDKQKTLADEISAVYEKLGLLNLEEGVLRNLEDNYASRMWDLTLPDAQRVYTTFYKDTKHAKERTWNTIVEGWLNGAELQTTGATQNLAMYKDTMIKTLLQRKLFNALKEVIAEVNSIKHPGKKMRQKLFLPYQAKGYVKIDLANFKIYSPLDIGDPGGRILETEDGTVLKETSIYAPKAVAKDIENLFGVSYLKKSKFVNTISKYNALIKVITLALSGFHALAFVASYYLGAPTGFANLNIYKAFKDGNMMAENLHPIAVLGVRNNLTVDLQQDWQRNYLREDNILNTLMEKTKTTGWIKDQIVAINDKWLKWVFSSFGAGLKIKTFALLYQKELVKFPNIDPNILASNVAQLVNEDFGGLHLKKLKRSPTTQHILQLALLAPDWTESNLRTITGMFRKTGQNPKHVRQLHRHFWAGIVTKGLIATAFTNLALALLTGTANDRWEDIDDFFTDTMRSWNQMLKELGRGNIQRGYQRYSEGTDTAVQLVREATSVNITPVYTYFGGDPEARKYFSIFRHFADPVKFALKPGIVIRHKLSMVSHMGLDLINQEDWKGRRYTTFPELLGGAGLVTYKSRYAEGTPFFDSWYVSYALSQIIGHTPIGMNNLISSISGETEYTDSILNTLGVHVATKRRR